MEHKITCNFSWRKSYETYGDPARSVTGDIRITSTSGLFAQFSFDIIYLYDLKFINSLPEQEQENLIGNLERFIDRIVIRKWVGEYYALPYTTINFPYDSVEVPLPRG